MSVGAAYILSANEGKMSAILNATAVLNDRINSEVERLSRTNNRGNVNPSLKYIEQSHILFVNAHIKPYAAIQQEYDHVSGCTGTAQYGQSLEFSVPQFGDFFADMGVHITLPQVSATTVPDTTVLPNISVANTVVGAENGGVAGYSYRYVNAQGAQVADGAGTVTPGLTLRNYVKYCDYPGIRLLSRVAFSVNGTPLDDYTREIAADYQRFAVPSDKKAGFDRLMGQERPLVGVTDLSSIANALPMQYPGGSAQPLPTFTSRQRHEVLSGPQTPKETQPALELLIPLLLWFCKDTRLAVPAVSIPPGQRFIRLEFARQEEMMCLAPSTFVEERFEGNDAVTGEDIVNVRRTPFLIPGSVLQDLSSLCFTTPRLFVNNLFTSAAVHNIYIDRVGFQLIRVHRYQTSPLTTENGDMLLNGLKWAVEFMFASFTPQINTRTNNPHHCEDWNKTTWITREDSALSVESFVPATVAASATATRLGTMTHQLTVSHPVNVLSKMHFVAQGNTIFKEAPSVFWNAYTPYRFGGENVVTPEDPGALMVNFSLYPGSYQPSGFLNFSRSREVYLHFISNPLRPIGTDTAVNLNISACAINFLLIADGGAVLRFST